MVWRALGALDAGAAGALWGPVLGALGLIGAGALTLWGTFRTSQRSASTAEAQRTSQVAEKQYANLEAQLARAVAAQNDAESDRAAMHDSRETMRRERDMALEQYHRLRISLLRAGIDPDNPLGRSDGSPHAPTPPQS